MDSRQKAILVIVLFLFAAPIVSADKLYGDALIYVSSSDASHPHVGSFDNIQDTNIDASRGSINLFDYPDSGTIEVNMYDDAQNFDIYRTGSYVEKCTLSTFDHDFASSEEGYVHIDQGVIVESNGQWPSVSSAAYESFDEGNLNNEQTALEVYQRMVNQGFVYEDVNAGSAEILASSGGSKQLRLKGDMICGDANEDGNAEWYICDGNMQYSSSRVQSHECNEANGEWEEYNSNCADPTIGDKRLDTTGGGFEVTAAFWDYDATGEYEDTTTGCTYNNAQPDSLSEYNDLGGSSAPFGKDSEPITFGCEQGTPNTIQGYPDVSSFDGSIARDYIRDAKGDAEDYCESRADRDFETAGDPLPMVQYYIPVSALPQDYGAGGSFVSTDGNYLGIRNYQISDLYQSMTRYDGGDLDYACDDCTKEETWTNKSMRNTAGYGADEPANYIDAWTTANVGGQGDEDVITDNGFEVNSNGEPTGVDSQDVFPGGFAGDCEGTLTWQYVQEDQEWTCSDALPLEQEIFFPQFDYPGDTEMVAVGFHFMPQLFNATEHIPFDQVVPNSFSQQVYQTFSESRHIEEFEAVCHWGGADYYSELEESNRGQTWFSIEYTNMPESPDNPIPVFGELNKTVKQNKGLAGPTCRWAHHEADENDNPTGEVYTTSGSVENKASNISNVVEQRGFTADSVNLLSDYASSELRSNIFRTVSQEWQNEAGYNRNKLGCVPNAEYFQSDASMNC